MIGIFFSVSVFIVVISLVLGFKLSLLLPCLHSFFGRKPFSCRPCFTFHLCWSIHLIPAFIFDSAVFLVAGVFIAFALFFITKYIDNQKIEK